MLISLVPTSPRPDRWFTVSVFAAVPQGSVFINRGRGSTVDEADLVSALENRQLSVAAIDVAQREPLSSASPLWTTKTSSSPRTWRESNGQQNGPKPQRPPFP
ncbi:NAD(P)-dependent oxidoreductase [Paenarthrobacter aurescens]|uniref:NAD(P)-dependent oxidoreductase n=1 Tax=Paenarthrobacter aurescens TaxID=43663 RepID=UPI0035F0E352